MSNLKRTPLFDDHVSLGARLVDFAGWEMPVQYEGVIAESKAARNSAGMFDVSHMGRTWFRGEKTIELLEVLTTNDISKLQDGNSQYSLLCYENGTCVDDIIVYRISSDVFRVVINASNREKDLEWMKSHNTFNVGISDETEKTAMIAVQGPDACNIVQELSSDDLLTIQRFSGKNSVVSGCEVFIARTGYTGEDGFELICSANDASNIWNSLFRKGVAPCGLASRDVLRVEAGLPLYGHELSDSINPIEAGLGWVVSKTKNFVGSEAINKIREEGVSRKLMGIRMSSKAVPREGYEVRVDGENAGTISSGVFSPVLDCGIAFAFIQSVYAKESTKCNVMIREKPYEAEIVNKRFLVKN